VVTLNNADRNKVFRWIEAEGLEPGDFWWSDWKTTAVEGYWGHPAEPGEMVRHRGLADDWFFATAVMPDSLHNVLRYLVVASSGYGGQGDGAEELGFDTFDEIRDSFSSWLRRVAAEAQPDLWLVLQRVQAQQQPGWPGDEWDDEPFTEAERREVAGRIARARQTLVDAGVTAERLAAADAKLDVILEGTRRLGHRDWRYWATGRLVEIALAVGLASPQAQQFIGRAFDGAGKLLGW
jgi:hypothetical protein